MLVDARNSGKSYYLILVTLFSLSRHMRTLDMRRAYVSVSASRGPSDVLKLIHFDLHIFKEDCLWVQDRACFIEALCRRGMTSNVFRACCLCSEISPFLPCPIELPQDNLKTADSCFCLHTEKDFYLQTGERRSIIRVHFHGLDDGEEVNIFW